MCYFVYGAMDKAVNLKDYECVKKKHDFVFNIGTKHDIKMSIVNESHDYRVTQWVCDCDFPLGSKNREAEEINELQALIEELRTVSDAKCLYLSKTWIGTKNKKEETIHLDDVDIKDFLANMETDCLYRIDLFNRY